jgi:hypothetical protein
LKAETVAMIHNAEPSLDELFGDCATRLLMAADGVHEGAVRALIDAVMQARREVRD